MAQEQRLDGNLAALAREAKTNDVGWKVYHSSADNSVHWMDRSGNEIAAHSLNVKGRPLSTLAKRLRAKLDEQYKDDKLRDEADKVAQEAMEPPRPAPLVVNPPEDPEPTGEAIETEVRSIQDVGPRFTVRLATVPTTLIKVADIDHGGYQRPPNVNHAVNLAKKFSWDDFDRLALSERDGYLWVLDGQHRMIALELTTRVPVDGKNAVPALVFEGMTLEDEADYYLRQNTDRKNTHPIHAWKARLVSEDKARTIEEIVKRNGYQVGTGGVGHIPSVSSLEEIYDDFGAEVLDQTLSVLHTAWPDERVSAPIIRGLSFVLGLYDNPDKARIIRHLSNQTAHAVHARIRFLASTNRGTQTVMCARFIVESYNYKFSPKSCLGPFDDVYSEFLRKKAKQRSSSTEEFFSFKGQKAVAKAGTWLSDSRTY